MKIWKRIEFSKEVEIDVTADDINLILEESDDLRQVLRNISTAVIYLESVPVKIIQQMNTRQKEVVVERLTGLIERMK